MKTIYFRDFEVTEHMGYNFYLAFKAVCNHKNIRMIFEPKVYELMPIECFERNLCCSNHGFNGPKRIAALIENAESIELDFCGATLRCVGVMTHIAILQSSHITIKNVKLENPQTHIMQGKIIAHGEGYVDIEATHGADRFVVRNQELILPAKDFTLSPIYWNVHFDGQTGEIGEGSTDNGLGVEPQTLRCEKLSDKIFRFYGVTRYPKIGDVIVFNAAKRLGSGIFCENSSNLYFENVTVYSCFGMGLLAQMCDTVTLEHFSTKRKDGQLYTANADATHFVHCVGQIKIQNSVFEGQLDDALNIHGMYTCVLQKKDCELFVREVHEQSRGIRIYKKNDRIQILRSDSLIPYTEKTIQEVEYINEDLIRLLLKESTADIALGDVVENITQSADLIFRHNTVRNNRARGMLLATRGKILVEDCHFHTSSSAIVFESNGVYWYESGATLDVVIRSNCFERCKYAYPRRRGIIACLPRQAVEKEKYFHKSIKVLNNKFFIDEDNTIIFDNVEHIEFIENESDSPMQVILHQVSDFNVQSDVQLVCE